MSECYIELKKRITSEFLKSKFNSGDVAYQARNLNLIALVERDIVPLAAKYCSKKVGVMVLHLRCNEQKYNYNYRP